MGVEWWFGLGLAAVMMLLAAYLIIPAYFDAKLDYQKKVMKELDQQDRKSKP